MDQGSESDLASCAPASRLKWDHMSDREMVSSLRASEAADRQITIEIRTCRPESVADEQNDAVVLGGAVDDEEAEAHDEHEDQEAGNHSGSNGSTG